jgi:hypothetical protein
MINVARTLFAVLTADDAKLSNGLIGNGTDFIISLKIAA